jgi:hypothetical protein
MLVAYDEFDLGQLVYFNSSIALLLFSARLFHFKQEEKKLINLLLFIIFLTILNGLPLPSHNHTHGVTEFLCTHTWQNIVAMRV